MKRNVITAAILAGALLSATIHDGRADQNDPRLDSLFGLLKTASNPIEGRLVEVQVWEIWLASDDAEVNRLMESGVAAMNGADYGEALKAFDRMVELAPAFAEGWNKRATLFYLMGDLEASMADIDRTLALEPRHFGALAGLGLVEMRREHEEEALAAFERALAVHPQMTGPRANAAYLKRRIQDRSI